MASSQCIHGYPPIIEARQHERYNAGLKSLQDHIFRLVQEKKFRGIGVEACRCFMGEYPDLNTPTMEKIVLCTGTNFIVQNNPGSMLMASELAQAILLMQFSTDINEEESTKREQNRAPDGDITRLADKEKKFSETLAGLIDSDRNVVKFYAKRIPCSCLDAKKKEYAKTGRCFNPACGKTQLDSTLMNCAACQLIKYCSKECQRADWPRHKSSCKKISKGLRGGDKK